MLNEQRNQTVPSNISLELKSLGQMLQILGIDWYEQTVSHMRSPM